MNISLLSIFALVSSVIISLSVATDSEWETLVPEEHQPTNRNLQGNQPKFLCQLLDGDVPNPRLGGLTACQSFRRSVPPPPRNVIDGCCNGPRSPGKIDCCLCRPNRNFPGFVGLTPDELRPFSLFSRPPVSDVSQCI